MTAPRPPRPRNRRAAATGTAASPVMAQYFEIKQAHPGCLLFFRMGDFFELFFDDAVAAAQALDIALTKRGRHDGADIPMCGVPVHTAETYLARLIRAGFKVAICEQVEDPAEARRRGAKGPVRRAVVRVVTAGTLTEEGLLDARRHNYLAGLAEAGGEIGLAWLDLSTGAFALAPTSEPTLAGDLARLVAGRDPAARTHAGPPCALRTAGRMEAGPDPAAQCPLRQRRRAAPARKLLRRRRARRLWQFQPRRDRRRRRAGRLRRPDPAGQGALSRTAAPGRAGLGHADRRRDPAQSRTGDGLLRRAPRQPAGDDRPHPDGGGRAALGRPSRRPADGAGSDRRPPRRGRFSDRRRRDCVRRCASGCAIAPISSGH